MTILTTPYIYDTHPIMVYHIYTGPHLLKMGVPMGVDHMQAICQAVKDALSHTIPSPYPIYVSSYSLNPSPKRY